MEASLEESRAKDAAQAKALLEAAAGHLGREITVSICRAAVSRNDGAHMGSAQRQEEESDDFYEFTQEDYARMVASKKSENYLKTKKIRDAEAASRRARHTKAIIRVLFPDNYILEAKFQPSDSLSSLIDLLKRVISRTDLPFYLYTTPPKQRLQDLKRDFYTAGLVPGAIVHFSYDIPKGVTEDEQQGILAAPYLQSDVMALQDLHLLLTPAVDAESPENTSSAFMEHKPEQDPNTRPRKSGTKPKWMKL
eukprot:c44331_g1_i1 orf=182-934(+)